MCSPRTVGQFYSRGEGGGGEEGGVGKAKKTAQ